MPTIDITTTDNRDYQVNRDIFQFLTGNAQPPGSMTEDALAEAFIDAMDAQFAITPGYNTNLQEHIESCAGVLINGPPRARLREMIGEVFAAMAMAASGWQMVWGYSGTGHTGLDQVWRKTAVIGGQVTAVAVVEAKGGNGVLSTIPRYFEGTTHRGQLGMNDDQGTTQMTPAWVFRNANNFIRQAFTACIINNTALPGVHQLTPAEGIFPNAGITALLICRILWRPLPQLATAYTGNVQTVDNVLNVPLTFQDFNGTQRCTVPDLRGFIITNGLCPFYDQRRYSEWA